MLRFADGTTFFVGLAVTLAAEVLLVRFRNRMARPALSVIALVGMVLVVISATPQPVWAYVIWLVSALGGLVLLDRPSHRKACLILSRAVLFAVTVGLCIAESPYRRCPTLRVPEGTTIYVLGDSISAGMGTKDRCWPVLLDEMTPLRVVNLAQPGATVESALVQTRGIHESPSLVILEIGGNDLLGGTDASAFARTLESLVSSLRASQHQVLLLELPLFPFQNAFGRAQRATASRYGVAMLPKRCFAAVLGTQNGTLDGLHLSQTGHNAMARIIAGVIDAE